MDDLDEAIAVVYAQPPSDFVAARSALVKQLKAEGRKGEAAAVAGLRRPTKLAWAIAEAVRRASDPAAAYFDAVAALAVPGGDLRRHTSDLRGAVAALAQGAEGVDAGEATAALMATAADPEATTALRRGRLAEVPAAGGFGLGALSPGPPEVGDAAAPEAGGVAAPSAEAVEPDRAGEAEAAARELREQEERERAEHLAALAAEVAEAAAAQDAAVRRVEAARVEVEAAELVLASATAALDRARDAAAEAAERLRAAEQR